MNKEDPPEIGKILARRIQDLCAQRSISINRLADMSGLPQQSLNSIIHGTSRNPKIMTLYWIARAFNMTLDEFLNYRELREFFPDDEPEESKNG